MFRRNPTTLTRPRARRKFRTDSAPATNLVLQIHPGNLAHPSTPRRNS
jgi:hypothetical protein